jgi:hypothetical protein
VAVRGLGLYANALDHLPDRVCLRLTALRELHLGKVI